MRRLVPALSAIVCAASASAVEVAGAPELTFSGFAETSLEAIHYDQNAFRDPNPGVKEGSIDFPSDADLRLGYKDEDFTLRVDMLAFSRPQYGDNVLLEQCFIDWKATSALTVRAGRFQNTWLGWEGFHTPELWRVNHSAAWDWNVQNHGALGVPKPFLSDGVGAIVDVPDTGVTIQGFVVKDVLGDVPGEHPDQIAAGGSVALKQQGVGRFELGAAIDPNSTVTEDGTGSTAVAVDVNADITAFREQGWFFASEVQVHRHPRLWVAGARWGNDLVALAMANYRLPEEPRVSFTVMLDYVERGFSADNNEVMEYAFAVLTKPRKSVLLNGEVFYWDETRSQADQYGLAAVLCVLLP
jgi:hypothetical protein